MSPWQYIIFIAYKIKCCVIDWHAVFIHYNSLCYDSHSTINHTDTHKLLRTCYLFLYHFCNTSHYSFSGERLVHMCDRLRIFTPTGTKQGQDADEEYVSMAHLLLEESVHLATKHFSVPFYIPYLSARDKQEPSAIYLYPRSCPVWIFKVVYIARGGWPWNLDTIPCGFQMVPGHIQSPVQCESASIRTVVKRSEIEAIKLTTQLLKRAKIINVWRYASILPYVFMTI